MQKRFENLSHEEKKVLKAFVDAGGAALTWRQVNRANISSSAVESLIHRGILYSSVTDDGMTETFVIKTEVFDLAQRAFKSSEPSRAALPTSDSDQIPF